MLRKLGLAISYFIAVVYILLILLPLLYCYQHQWCKGAVSSMHLCRLSCSLRWAR